MADPTPSYAELSEFDRLYVPRPAEPTDADRMIAALRRIAKATYKDAAVVERVLADNNRLEDENASLRGELLWWQKEHGFQRMNGEFGTAIEEGIVSFGQDGWTVPAKCDVAGCGGMTVWATADTWGGKETTRCMEHKPLGNLTTASRQVS